MTKGANNDDGLVRKDFQFNAPTQAAPSTPPAAPPEYDLQEAELVRTQIHLSPLQRQFLTERAAATGKSMALQIRELIDLKMNPKTTDWDLNPLLAPPAADPDFESASSDSQNSDAAIYGSYEP